MSPQKGTSFGEGFFMMEHWLQEENGSTCWKGCIAGSVCGGTVKGWAFIRGTIACCTIVGGIIIGSTIAIGSTIIGGITIIYGVIVGMFEVSESSLELKLE